MARNRQLTPALRLGEQLMAREPAATGTAEPPLPSGLTRRE